MFDTSKTAEHQHRPLLPLPHRAFCSLAQSPRADRLAVSAAATSRSTGESISRLQLLGISTTPILMGSRGIRDPKDKMHSAVAPWPYRTCISRRHMPYQQVSLDRTFSKKCVRERGLESSFEWLSVHLVPERGMTPEELTAGSDARPEPMRAMRGSSATQDRLTEMRKPVNYTVS